MATSRAGLDREATFETGSTLTNNDSKSNKSDKAAKGPGFFERKAVGVLTGLARFRSSEKKKIAEESGGDADAEKKAWLDKAVRVVAKNNLPGLGVLERAGADLNAKSSKEHGATAAHYAGFYGHTNRLQQLSELGADVHAADNDGRTALHDAAARGHAGTVQKMIDLGANLEATDKNDATPLHFAAARGRNEATNTLLANGADPLLDTRNNDGHTATDLASMNRHSGVLDTIKSHRMGRLRRLDESSTLPTPAKTPGFWKDIGSVISKHSSTALANMATRQKGGDLTKEEKLDKALRSAAKSNLFSGLRTRILLNNGARADTVSEYTGKSAMHEAAERNKLGVLKQHTAADMDINASSDTGKTALDYAVRKGNAKAADLLLARGGSGTRIDGRSASDVAELYGHKKLAKRIDVHREGRTRVDDFLERAAAEEEEDDDVSEY